MTLIENIDKIILGDGGSADGENSIFQRASATIDASVQIYSTRVDAIHREAFSLLGGLQVSKGKEPAEEETEDGTGAKKRARKVRTDTLEKAEDLQMTLNGSEFAGDMERLTAVCGDSSALDALLVHRMPHYLDTVPILDGRGAPPLGAMVDMDLPRGGMVSGPPADLRKLFGPVEAALYGPAEDEGEGVTVDEGEGANAAMDDDDSDDGDNGALDDFGDLLAAVDDIEGELDTGDAIQTVDSLDQRPTGNHPGVVTLPELEVGGWTRGWAMKAVKTEQEGAKTTGGRPTKGVVKSEIPWDTVIVVPKSKRATLMPAGKQKATTRLKPQMSATFDPARLSLIPSTGRPAPFHGDAGGVGVGVGVDPLAEVEQLVGAIDVSVPDEMTVDAVHDDLDDGFGMGDSDSDGPEGHDHPEVHQGRGGLRLRPVRGKSRVGVRPAPVNLRRLKGSLLTAIPPGGSIKFSTLLAGLPETHPYRDLGSVTVHIGFVTLLHLCNDHGMTLTKEGGDFIISRPSE